MTPSLARGFGQGESGRALVADQRKAGLHQRLAQIAVVVALLDHAVLTDL